ncbi:hypothetical protein SEA_AMETHYST_72 [Streptomyces phage Amethyst]|uniref:Uncharacterized protein n=1 Tax=Streptomyces phage Amethyst TaxID=2041205 RepID=A0A291LH01_9CAUD|nr:hypothetical protein KGG83_gp72 [Streptomyces phage Amethyst]ATI18692.1 hypothetical protein SEA_AMETHYST_72 [Streptomyces phage Amethyst]
MKTAVRMVPSNVVRCQDDNGPILYPQTPGPYRCSTCGGGLKPGQTPQVGAHWDESYGYLVEVETEDDPRDTEEEIGDLYDAISVFADILGDGMTAHHVGGSFTCTEAERLAQALMTGGHKRAAMTFLEGHASGDDDIDDIHQDVGDYEAYVLTLAGKAVPELVEEPEPETPPTPAMVLAIVTTDDLLKLMNLD